MVSYLNENRQKDSPCVRVNLKRQAQFAFRDGALHQDETGYQRKELHRR